MVGDFVQSPDGDVIAASYVYGEDTPPGPAVVLWDLHSGREVARMAGPSGEHYFPAFSPDGRLVAARSQSVG